MVTVQHDACAEILCQSTPTARGPWHRRVDHPLYHPLRPCEELTYVRRADWNRGAACSKSVRLRQSTWQPRSLQLRAVHILQCQGGAIAAAAAMVAGVAGGRAFSHGAQHVERACRAHAPFVPRMASSCKTPSGLNQSDASKREQGPNER